MCVWDVCWDCVVCEGVCLSVMSVMCGMFCGGGCEVEVCGCGVFVVGMVCVN